MKHLEHLATDNLANNHTKDFTQQNDKVVSNAMCLSFWVSDSALAYEYFHTRLGCNLIETSRDNEGICSMCFAMGEDEKLKFHIHFDREEEHFKLLQNDEDYLEKPRQFLKLVPVLSSDPGACIFMNYGSYE